MSKQPLHVLSTGHGSKSRTPSEHPNPHENRLKTIGVDPQPTSNEEPDKRDNPPFLELERVPGSVLREASGQGRLPGSWGKLGLSVASVPKPGP